MASDSQREELLFNAAREIADPAARSAYLDEACAGDLALRAQVERLLSASEDTDAFFAGCAPALEEAAAALVPSQVKHVEDIAQSMEEKPGSKIGPYKLLQKIGEGGCGIVYMAEQERPVRRRVALKIIKLGMDTKSVIARFEAERQALAMMDHPNIARVLDAGATEAGRPYFVMELVYGSKITDYCDQNQLAVSERLRIFIQVCQGLQHAHQKGIIHRDIKPSNILVTMHDGVPVPKVIDFGIAKATEQSLTDKTLFTSYSQLIGTPAYMSPEQMELSGLNLDTRSDIYCLGVLLYELLTGRTPFDTAELLKAGVDEMRRTLQEREPTTPSAKLRTLSGEELTKTALQRQVDPRRFPAHLRGDLDRIVMKCLEKNRNRRYETANGLAMDIQRHLNDEPVLARPPSQWYRFQRLVRRNRIVFASGATIAAALLGATAISMRLYLEERAALRSAVAARQDAESARQDAESARVKEAQLRREAELRETVSQAALLAEQHKYDEAEKLLGRISLDKSSLEAEAVLRPLGEWHALRQEWREAADRFGVLLQVNQLDDPDIVAQDYTECGVTLVESGDNVGYEHVREDAIKRFKATERQVAAERVVKISLLLPADNQVLVELAPLVQIAARPLTSADGSPSIIARRDAWRSISVALFEYRSGNYAKAAEWSRRCLACPEKIPARTGTARVILAMSLHQIGEDEAAHSEIKQARDLFENQFDSGLKQGEWTRGFWFDWILGRVLLREASGLLPAEPDSSKPLPRKL